MRIRRVLVLFIFFSSLNAYAQLEKYSFEQLDSIMTKEPKKAVVFIHTSWCKYCNKMEHLALKNEAIIQELNNNFYFVSLDAAYKEIINYKGQRFYYKPNGNNTGVHSLAEQLGTINGQLQYPTLVVLNSNNEIIFQYSGYMKIGELLAVLQEAKKEKGD